MAWKNSFSDSSLQPKKTSFQEGSSIRLICIVKNMRDKGCTDKEIRNKLTNEGYKAVQIKSLLEKI